MWTFGYGFHKSWKTRTIKTWKKVLGTLVNNASMMLLQQMICKDKKNPPMMVLDAYVANASMLVLIIDMLKDISVWWLMWVCRWLLSLVILENLSWHLISTYCTYYNTICFKLHFFNSSTKVHKESIHISILFMWLCWKYHKRIYFNMLQSRAQWRHVS